MPPLPEFMHYLQTGWWWLQAFASIALFSWSWFLGQNQAEPRFLELQPQREQEKR